MNTSLDSPPRVAPSVMDSAAGRTARILSLRESVIRMRGLATRSRSGFREQLLSLARDTERHVTLLEALRAEAAATWVLEVPLPSSSSRYSDLPGSPRLSAVRPNGVSVHSSLCWWCFLSATGQRRRSAIGAPCAVIAFCVWTARRWRGDDNLQDAARTWKRHPYRRRDRRLNNLNGNGLLQMNDGKHNIHFGRAPPKAANMNEQSGQPGQKSYDATTAGPASRQHPNEIDQSTLKEWDAFQGCDEMARVAALF